MAFYRQNQGNIPPRNGTAPCKNAYPYSITVYGPDGYPQSMSNPGTTNPSSGFRASPHPDTQAAPTFGRHDGLAGRLMEVSQADMYLSPPQPFPRAGTYEEPGAAVAVMQMVRLQPSTSAHPGLAQATGAGPAMLFVAPPVFTIQSKPIYALGL